MVIEPTRLKAVGDHGSGFEFSDFFRAEYAGLVRSLYLLTADLPEAEDLAQEAMARTYERWDRIKLMDSPGGYVYRAAVNINRKRMRHLAVRRRRSDALARAGDYRQPPETLVELTEALASLTIGQREAFLLVEWIGLSAEEAGRILRIAPASVRSRTHRARATLSERLGEQEEDP